MATKQMLLSLLLLVPSAAFSTADGLEQAQDLDSDELPTGNSQLISAPIEHATAGAQDPVLRSLIEIFNYYSSRAQSPQHPVLKPNCTRDRSAQFRIRFQRSD